MRSLQGFPWLAHVYADYFRLNDLAMASHLEQKRIRQGRLQSMRARLLKREELPKNSGAS